MTYGATVQNAFEAILPDTQNQPYAGPQWKDVNGDGVGENRYPLAYARSGAVNGALTVATANPRISLVTDNPQPGNTTYSIRGRLVVPGVWGIPLVGGVLFAETDATLNGNTLVPNVALQSAPLPDVIGKLPLTIKWEVKIGNGEWFSAGGTSNVLYLSGADLTQPVRETVLDIGCRNAGGLKPTDAQGKRQILDAIWDNFEATGGTPSVRNAAGTVMKYWGTWTFEHATDSSLGTIDGLLNHRDGTCEAWARLLVAVLNAQGVVATAQGIEVRSELSPQLPAGAHLLGRPGLQVFPTLPAQGGVPKQSLFSNHAVVLVPNLNIDGRVYDPSYGKIHDSLIAWESASVVAYRYGYDSDGDGNEDGFKALWEQPHQPDPDQSQIENTRFFDIPGVP